MKDNLNLLDFLTAQDDPAEIFQTLEMIGQGTFGCVYKALHIKSGKIVAAKIMDVVDRDQIESFVKEIKVLKNCQNPNIVQYYGSYYKNYKMWIVLEYCDAGSVGDLITMTKTTLNEEQIASIVYMVLKGLEFLHGKKLIHRDIKAENILLTNEGCAKLADFGVSEQLMNSFSKRYTKIGSPYWMSPEVIKRNEYNTITDIWSLGITCIQLAEGRPPMTNIRDNMVMYAIVNNPPKGLTEPKKWSNDFNNFVQLCLTVDPLKRPPAKELLKHPFIKNKNKGTALISELVSASIKQIYEVRNTQNDENDDEYEDLGTQRRLDSTINNANNTFVNNSGTVVSKNNSFDAGTMVRKGDTLKSVHDKSRQKVKNDSQPQFLQIMEKMHMFNDLDEVDKIEKVSKAKLNIHKDVKVYEFKDPKNEKNGSKKVLIRYPTENSTLGGDNMSIANERETMLRISESIEAGVNQSSHASNNENLNSNSDSNPFKGTKETNTKKQDVCIDILDENFINKVPNLDISQLLEDTSLNKQSASDLAITFDKTLSNMDEEIRKIKQAYTEKLIKCNLAYSFLKQNPHLKNIKEYEELQKFSKKFGHGQNSLSNNNMFNPDPNTMTIMNGDTVMGNSVYHLNAIKTSDYKPNDIRKID